MPLMSRFPKPAFGSNPNLYFLNANSPNSRPIPRTSRPSPPSRFSPPTRSTPSRPSPPSRISPPQRPIPIRSTPPSRLSRRKAIHGSFTGLCDMDTDDSNYSNSECHSCFGWEITVATVDRHGLLTYLTSTLSSSSLNLNIREAHAFSTSDGMALEVFVVDGWRGAKDYERVEELKQEMLNAIANRLSSSDSMEVEEETKKEMSVDQLRAAVDAMAYEDWAVDYNDLELLEKLGCGASGRLYKGIYRGQEVAVKVMSLSGTTGDNHSGTFRAVSASELLNMFKQEVSIMRIVRHKNLVQFIGACSCWPKLFIVTELMAGGSVRDMIQRRNKSLDYLTVIKILRDCARGMDFLHKRGVVHRDLKAANLLIDEHNVVKVCDFGVARMKPNEKIDENNPSASSNSEMTAETGTYRWMAPEVLEHKPYDHKVDVYSFGITAWEITTGEVPYSGLSPLQAAVGVVQRSLRPEIPPSIPPRLSSLIQRCWSYNPEDRPEFSEILSILEDCLKPAGLWKRTLMGSHLS